MRMHIGKDNGEIGELYRNRMDVRTIGSNPGTIMYCKPCNIIQIESERGWLWKPRYIGKSLYLNTMHVNNNNKHKVAHLLIQYV